MSLVSVTVALYPLCTWLRKEASRAVCDVWFTRWRWVQLSLTQTYRSVDVCLVFMQVSTGGGVHGTEERVHVHQVVWDEWGQVSTVLWTGSERTSHVHKETHNTHNNIYNLTHTIHLHAHTADTETDTHTQSTIKGMHHQYNFIVWGTTTTTTPGARPTREISNFCPE